MKHASATYSAGADPELAFPALDGDARADVAIIGGGYTGLSAALHLAERGVKVVLLEGQRVGWGASGRNGGQLHSGQRMDQDYLEKHLGFDAALELWKMGEEAKTLFNDLRTRHQIECEWRPGLIESVHKKRLVTHERAYVEKLNTAYGYAAAEWLDKAAVAEQLGTDVYEGGRLDHTAGHLHPLKWAQGLARAAAKAGARIHENTMVTQLSESGARRLVTAHGTVTADVVILAGNGYLDGIDRFTEERAMPIVNYILATEPIGAGQPGGVLPTGVACSDTRFVVYYFRPSQDGRLLFGGGETYHRPIADDVKRLVRKHLLRIYPMLSGVRIDDAWDGTLAITRRRLPLIRRLRARRLCRRGIFRTGRGARALCRQGARRRDWRRHDAARQIRGAALPAVSGRASCCVSRRCSLR